MSDARRLANDPFDDDVFQTAVLIYTLYHLPDRGQALREVGRVLAPGGMVAFFDTTAAIESWMPLPRLLADAGLPALAEEFNRHWFSRYDSNRTCVAAADYPAWLDALGFEVVELRPFMCELPAITE